MHRLLPSNRIEELASCHDYRLSRMLLYPWVAFDVVTQASLPRRTTTTPTAPYLSAHFPTGLTLPYKSGLCPSTSCSCITNFEYTLTFASRSPDPIISKAADSPHYPSCRTVPVPRHPTPGLALRHHLTHLHHDHDPIPIFGVFPPSPSEIARVLLDGGVITNPKDSQGQTPWHAWLKAEGTMISLLDYYWSAARMSTCQTMITIPITFGIGGGNCNPARSARPTEPEWETSQAPPSVARLRSFGT
ncbi:hypothetical protein EDB83DRAFT_2527281 [Lactarius deliciosus]|nr:hypothetical protein EDB83DRAFT_2527281 [Lactarius deliciosus]